MEGWIYSRYGNFGRSCFPLLDGAKNFIPVNGAMTRGVIRLRIR